MKENIKEETMKMLEEMHRKYEIARAEGRCKIFTNPDIIEYITKEMMKYLFNVGAPNLLSCA